jgi:hypothetical protein
VLTGGAADRLLSHLSRAHNLPLHPQRAQAPAIHDHAAELHQLLVQSGIALAIMTVIAVAIGWLVAARVLGPPRPITSTTSATASAHDSRAPVLDAVAGAFRQSR